jgi:hypothetical protein
LIVFHRSAGFCFSASMVVATALSFASALLELGFNCIVLSGWSVFYVACF